MTVGRKEQQALRQAREQKGWTQADVAEYIGSTPLTVYRWERGQSFPSPYYRQKLCEVFGASLDALNLIPDEAVSKEQNASVTLWESISMTLPPTAPLEAGLIGREELLDTLCQQLSSPPTTWALVGLPGVGKTALSVTLAYHPRLQNDFPDGMLWVGLGPTPPILALQRLWGQRLGITEAEAEQVRDSEEWQHTLHARIGDRRMLIIIDDAWSLADAQAFKVGGPYCAHILTTRSPTLAAGIAGTHTLRIPELDQAQSLALLQHLAPVIAEQERDAVYSLVQAIGGLPLALTLIGHALHVQSVTNQPRRFHMMWQRLHQPEERLQLSELGTISSISPSLQATIQESLDALPPAAQLLFRSLAVLPAKPVSFSEDVVVALLDSPIVTVIEALDTLVDHGILETQQNGRYLLHPILRDYGQMYGDLGETEWRYMRYYADLVQDPLFEDVMTEQELVLLLDATGLMQRQSPSFFVATVVAVTGYLIKRGLLAIALPLVQDACTLARTEQMEQDLAELLVHAGRIALQEGRTREAEQLAWTGLQITATLQQRAKLLHVSGVALVRQGHIDDAIRALQEGLSLLQGEELPVQGKLLLALGSVWNSCGNHSEAERCYRRGLQVVEQLGLHDGRSAFLMNLGNLAAKHGNPANAQHYFQEALALVRQAGSQETLIQVLANLSELTLSFGDKQEAYLTIEEGISLVQKSNLQVRENYFFRLRAELAIHEGRLTDAREWAEQAVVSAQRSGYQEELCWALLKECQVALAAEQWIEAEKYYTMAREMTKLHLYARLDLHVIVTLGWLKKGQGELEQAHETFDEGIRLAEIQHDREQEAVGRFGQAQVAQQQGQLTLARLEAIASYALMQDIHYYQADVVKKWLDQLDGKDH